MNERSSSRRAVATALVLVGCAGVLTTHLVTLHTSGQDPVRTPVSALSHGVDGHLHGLGLALFAAAQLALATLLSRPGVTPSTIGWPTRIAQALLVVDAALIVYLAWHFARAADAVPGGPEPGDPLSLLASGTGLVMSFALPGLLKRHRPAGLWNLVCLVAWLALVPPALIVDGTWIGAYERLVGAVFVAWTAGLAVLIGFTPPRST